MFRKNNSVRQSCSNLYNQFLYKKGFGSVNKEELFCSVVSCISVLKWSTSHPSKGNAIYEAIRDDLKYGIEKSHYDAGFCLETNYFIIQTVMWVCHTG